MDFVDYWKENYRTDVINVVKTNGMIKLVLLFKIPMA